MRRALPLGTSEGRPLWRCLWHGAYDTLMIHFLMIHTYDSLTYDTLTYDTLVIQSSDNTSLDHQPYNGTLQQEPTTGAYNRAAYHERHSVNSFSLSFSLRFSKTLLHSLSLHKSVWSKFNSSSQCRCLFARRASNGRTNGRENGRASRNDRANWNGRER